MSDPNETIADIVNEMRALTESCGTKRRVNIPTITVRSWNGLLDRIEAAAKSDHFRDATKMHGNAAALREALETVADAMSDCRNLQDFTDNAYLVWDSRRKIRAALAAPARNCDVFPDFDKAFGFWMEHHPAYPGTRTMMPFNEWLCATAEKKGGVE